MANSSPSSSKPLINQVDWYAIASKIRIQNEKLKAKISELETIIEEQKQQIKVQVIKNQDYFNLEENQQEEIRQLELEITEKDEQITNQSSTADALTQELEKIQQQTARLERECSLIQDSYNEQQHQLKQVEKENKELKIRLQRQQRYNIQYKTALDQVINASSGEGNANSVIKSFTENSLPPSFATNKNQLNSTTPEEIIPENQDIIDTIQENELKENILEIKPSSQEENSNNSDFVKLASGESENQNNILKKVDMKESKIAQETPLNVNNEDKEEKKPRRRMFIQLPQFGRKKDDE